MSLDTSAILAILLREDEAHAFIKLIGEAHSVGVGSPTLSEAGIVYGSRSGFELSRLHSFLWTAQVSVIPFGESHWSAAVTACKVYGKGRHKAGLNYGDCLAYAAAKLAKQPLLCKGNDFTQTDLTLVRY